MTGLFCPGQGSQFVGMGADLARAFSAARLVFEEADDALGISLSRLCWEGPEEELTRTDNAQPAILVHTFAVWRVLDAERPLSVRSAAGHSLGEFSAYLAAGAFSLREAVATVRRRGELMYDSGSTRAGTMLATLGLDDVAAESVCRQAESESGGVVVPANYNSPGQIVFSGDVEAVRRAGEVALAAGAKRVIPLNVSGAFHSPLMQIAEEGLRASLASVDFAGPAFPVVSNVTAEHVNDPAVARDLLVRQLTAPVRWVQSVRAMLDRGVREFVEIGPGNVLTGLLRRIDRSVPGRALSTLDDVQAYLREES